MTSSFKAVRSICGAFALAAWATFSHTAVAADISYEAWQRDVEDAVSDVGPYLQNRLSRGGSNLAIVLDIDNTALVSSDFPEEAGRANAPVLEVARWAHEHGYAILFVSYRSEGARNSTIRALQGVGYAVDALCLRNGSGARAASKQRCRRELASSGYTITANIGNLDTDLEGGDYEQGFKLPDYGVLQ
ncbi:HAD family acid phosphatase [Pendulispora brunnea]|uniref:HAD family acid phosphatase n=1 Tax=Pendulispora brunnea TaxID=2905690 RepID=A0ABZ2KAV9_9BACT